MSSYTDDDDAHTRAYRMVHVLEKSISDHSTRLIFFARGICASMLTEVTEPDCELSHRRIDAMVRATDFAACSALGSSRPDASLLVSSAV
jgi:hypothetical protein